MPTRPVTKRAASAKLVANKQAVRWIMVRSKEVFGVQALDSNKTSDPGQSNKDF
jgi:hypothetical protein